jgi:hypothetical protein
MLREPEPLDADTLRALLVIAARSVDAALRHEDPPETECTLEAAQRGGGAFVTLRHAEELRGCIGTIAAAPPLWRTVRSMARSATLEDDRFVPLSEGERDSIRVELSVLGEPFPIATDEIELGVHGLILHKDGVRGLLLPQVAMEHGLDRDQFLEALCQKSALPKDAWRDADVRLWAFRTQSVAAPLNQLLKG